MSCELKYRFTSLLCKIVNNNMCGLQGTDRSFFVRVSFLCLNYFPLTATSRGNDPNVPSLALVPSVWASNIKATRVVMPLANYTGGEEDRNNKSKAINSFLVTCQPLNYLSL